MILSIMRNDICTRPVIIIRLYAAACSRIAPLRIGLYCCCNNGGCFNKVKVTLTDRNGTYPESAAYVHAVGRWSTCNALETNLGGKRHVCVLIVRVSANSARTRPVHDQQQYISCACANNACTYWYWFIEPAAYGRPTLPGNVRNLCARRSLRYDRRRSGRSSLRA